MLIEVSVIISEFISYLLTCLIYLKILAIFRLSGHPRNPSSIAPLAHVKLNESATKTITSTYVHILSYRIFNQTF